MEAKLGSPILLVSPHVLSGAAPSDPPTTCQQSGHVLRSVQRITILNRRHIRDPTSGMIPEIHENSDADHIDTETESVFSEVSSGHILNPRSKVGVW